MKLHEELGAVRRETVLDAPREDVWALVGRPEGLAAWLGDDVTLEAVTPGPTGTLAEGDEQRRVTIEDVEAGRRVALSWCAPGGEPSLVELTLDDDGPRTRLTVVEVPIVRLRSAATAAATRALAASRPRGPQMAAAA